MSPTTNWREKFVTNPLDGSKGCVIGMLGEATTGKAKAAYRIACFDGESGWHTSFAIYERLLFPESERDGGDTPSPIMTATDGEHSISVFPNSCVRVGIGSKVVSPADFRLMETPDYTDVMLESDEKIHEFVRTLFGETDLWVEYERRTDGKTVKQQFGIAGLETAIAPLLRFNSLEGSLT